MESIGQCCRTLVTDVYFSVVDPLHFGADPDPDPRICTSG
jgi:hypothetical protein